MKKKKGNISYKETHRHVRELVTAGILIRDRKKKQKHQPVYVKLR